MNVEVLQDTRGSASVEFVLLALPLFIPILIFASTFSSANDFQEQLRTLARESARAFVTSSNDATAYEVTSSVVYQGAKILGMTNPESNVQIDIQCSVRPCISPDAQVVVTLFAPEANIRVSALEYVSPWA